MKILAGVLAPDQGRIELDGREVRFDSTQAALEKGIAIIHQELQLADNLTAAENVYLGREPRRGPFVDRAALERGAAELFEKLGLRVAPSTRVDSLSIGQQQLVEIAKALATDARILIMDEPTSSLSLKETEHLYGVVRDLKARGVAILYISHRLGEVKELADRVEVMRDGKNVGRLAKDEISHDAMVRLMVGRDLARNDVRDHSTAVDLLTVDRIRTRRNPQHEVSFRARRGEIVGVAGLVGAGRTELLEALFGVVPPLAGRIHVAGIGLDPKAGPRAAIRAGIALVPEDRKQQGLLLDESIRANLALPNFARLRRNRVTGLRNVVRERELAEAAIREVAIKCRDDLQLARELSGGNQQKIVLGKWLARRPAVLLLDEPTRGVDVGAKDEIYRLLRAHAERGGTVVFVSSEMEEVLSLADRVLVMHEGRLAGELLRGDATEESVMQLATGKSLRANEGPR